MKIRSLILTALFAALTAIGAFLKIPTPTSSFTLQFFFTCMAGVLLGAKCAALSQAVYVLLGLVGLPIFTLGGGFSYVFQPTFGFLLGLIPAAALVGFWVQKKGCGFASICLSSLLGLAVLYLIGLPYMHLILTVYQKSEWTLRQTVMGGMVLFLPWDALKIVVTGLLGAKLAPRIRQTAP